MEENGRVTVVVNCRGAVAVNSERVIVVINTVLPSGICGSRSPTGESKDSRLARGSLQLWADGTAFLATELSVLCNYIAS